MLKLSVISANSAADDEVVALIAAISAYETKKLNQRAAAVIQRSPKSSWKLAGLLENTGAVPACAAPLPQGTLNNPWKAKHLPKLLSFLPLFCFALQSLTNAAFAQQPFATFAPDAMADNYGLQPQQAPQRDSSDASTRIPADSSQSSIIQRQPEAPASTMMRVGLSLNASVADIDLPDGAVLKNVTGDTLAELPPQSRWHMHIRASAGSSQICFTGKLENVARGPVRVACRSQYRNVAFVSGTIAKVPNLIPLPSGRQPQFLLPQTNESTSGPTAYTLVPPPDGAIGFGGRLYRGSLTVRTKTSKPSVGDTDKVAVLHPDMSGTQTVSVINNVDLEDYLLSVVPSEMPSGWPIEALKAQAITARSFALARMGRFEADGYDVKATMEDQVYTGVNAETANSNRAVAETSGLVLKHEGKIVTAFFHSASGGFTELSENVWSKPVPYLKAVPDFDDESPHFSWTRSFNIADAENVINQSGRSIGSLLAVIPVARGISPRVRWLMAVGTDKTLFISGELARRLFALPSSSFNVSSSTGSYIFAGRGFGHGLGMSQWGAKKLAEAGCSFDHILSYYYKDITIDRI